MKLNKYFVIILLLLNQFFLLHADWNFHSEDKLISYYLGLKEGGELNRFVYHPLVETEYNKGFNIEPSSMLASFNSTYAKGINDGAPLQGRGLNGRIDLGLAYSGAWYSFSLMPEFWVSQNSDFDIIPTSNSSGYGDYYADFDNLQRYGDDIFSEFNLGQSYIELRWKEILDINISTRNFQYGSSKYNPIIMSNNSKGIPNINWGTHKPLPLLKGNWEFRIFYGQLNESKFYSGSSPDSKAFLSSTVLAYKPEFIPGLSLGVSTLYYRPWSNIQWTDSFGALKILYGAITSAGKVGATSEGSGSDDSDQSAALYIDWYFPASNFHCYAEWARNDFSGGLDNFILFPEHSQGLTIGFSKLIESGVGDFMLSFEFTELMQQRDYVFHPAGPWYRHAWGDSYHQGYSNSGQIFGAPIGPGSNSQTIELVYFRKSQKHELKFNRTLYDNDYFYNVYVPNVGLNGANYFDASLYAERVELNMSLKSTFNFDTYDLMGGFTISYYMNHNYIPSNDLWNFYAQLGFRYHIN